MRTDGLYYATIYVDPMLRRTIDRLRKTERRAFSNMCIKLIEEGLEARKISIDTKPVAKRNVASR